MILSGTLDSPSSEPIVRLTANIDDFTRYVLRAARQVTALDVMLEVIGLTVDQTWATFYVRGGMDPEFADEAARDEYLRALLKVKGERGQTAVEAFLRGWFTHRPHDAALDHAGRPLAWHRLIGDTVIYVDRTGATFIERGPSASAA